ncbi:MAG TPA: FRG domain-containing protein, partial [Anaerolineaceae bacterium]|nr:FRG domain-containing protein [Anaerolineaceae bacterium]
MREISPSFFPDLEKHVEGQVLRKTTPFPVQSYHELVRKVAQLSFLNKDFLLFFRGQDQDYQNKAESSTFYPTIYRKEILTSQEIRSRFELLEVATNKLVEAFDREKLDGRVDIRRKQYIAWSILQHYGVCDTPLLDLTQSLRVAATFAQLGNKAERGMVYVFGLPYTTNRITYNSEQDLVIV